MVRPIPKQLLIHSVQYREYEQNERWGERWLDVVPVINVLVKPSTSLTVTATREQVNSQSILFLDAKYSKPFVEMKEKSEVIFNGRTMKVNKVSPFYTFDGDLPHHYEVELI